MRTSLWFSRSTQDTSLIKISQRLNISARTMSLTALMISHTRWRISSMTSKMRRLSLTKAWDLTPRQGQWTRWWNVRTWPRSQENIRCCSRTLSARSASWSSSYLWYWTTRTSTAIQSIISSTGTPFSRSSQTFRELSTLTDKSSWIPFRKPFRIIQLTPRN